LVALPGLSAGGGGNDFVAPLLQIILQQAAGDGIVFSNQEFHRGFRAGRGNSRCKIKIRSKIKIRMSI
jgi:hypothetical protein